MAAVAGGQSDAELLIAVKDMLNRLGSESLCTEEIFPMDGAGYVRLTVFASRKLRGLDDAEYIFIIIL